MTKGGGLIGADGPLYANSIDAEAPTDGRGRIGAVDPIDGEDLIGAAGQESDLMAALTEDGGQIGDRGLIDGVNLTDAGGAEVKIE